jgi:hypothetical protein
MGTTENPAGAIDRYFYSYVNDQPDPNSSTNTNPQCNQYT